MLKGNKRKWKEIEESMEAKHFCEWFFMRKIGIPASDLLNIWMIFIAERNISWMIVIQVILCLLLIVFKTITNVLCCTVWRASELLFFIVNRVDCMMWYGVIYRKTLVEIPGLTQDTGGSDPRFRWINTSENKSKVWARWVVILLARCWWSESQI